MATPKLRLSIAVAATALAFAVPSYAGVRKVEVQVSDLDLSRPSGQEQLNGRIDRAVRKVCRSEVTRNLGKRRDVSECEANARADAEEQMTQRIAEHRDVRKNALKSRLRVASD